MSLRTPPSPRQGLVWSLRRRGLEPPEIAKELEASRQFVHQTLSAADAKVSRLLMEAARANRMEVQSIDVKNGLLTGYHRGLEKEAGFSYQYQT